MKFSFICLFVIALSQVIYGAISPTSSESIDHSSAVITELKHVSFIIDGPTDAFFCTTLLAMTEQKQTFYGPILVLPNSLRDICLLNVNPAPRLSSINGVTARFPPRDAWKVTFTDWKIDGQPVDLVAVPNCIYLIRKDRLKYTMRIVPVALASGATVDELKERILKAIRN